ncbi:2158_t:CDS:2 [Gigaspora margarita]|uniref:2158_t:CDS:1 n=1 Tax=Gigaspora margarita TaxID=4874 RepID=A0ABN7W833_GIGMA|nr:2158_t:CDS:2 [Gigaspora margarita]
MSNNSPSFQSHESAKSNSENSIELNINLKALQKSASNLFQKTESEVAIMDYIHLKMNILVPKVYYWNSSVNNPVGAEYIIMDTFLETKNFTEILISRKAYRMYK